MGTRPHLPWRRRDHQFRCPLPADNVVMEALEPRLLLDGETLSVADFFPLTDGLQWGYEYNDNGDVFDIVQEAVNPAPGYPGRAGLKITVPGEPSFEETDFFTVDANGLSQYGFDGEGIDEDWGPYTEWEVYDPAYNVLPATVTVGAVYENTNIAYHGEWTDQQVIVTWAGTAEETLTIAGWETITVPFGTLACLRIDIQGTWEDTDNFGTTERDEEDCTLWLAEGVGIVKEVSVAQEWTDGVYQGVDNESRTLTAFNGELPGPGEADLAVSNLTGVAGSYAAGEALAGSALVENAGDGDVTDAFWYEARLSGDATWGNADDISVYLEQTSDDVAEGAEFWHNWSGAIPAGTAPGSYFLGLMVDSTGAVLETTDANNTVWTPGPNVVVIDEVGSDQSDIARALDLPAGVDVTYSGDTDAVQHRVLHTSGGLLSFPSGRDGDFLMLSTGVAAEVDTVENTAGNQGTDLGGDGETGDLATIAFTLPVPASDQDQKLKFDFIFLSEEYPEYVNKGFNDTFTATVNGTNIALDQLGNPVEVDNVFFDGDLATDGTFFDGRTWMLTAAYTVPDGTTSLDVELSIWDEGDGIYDSAALLDNVRFETSQVVYLNFDGQQVSLGGKTFTMPAFDVADLGYDAGENRQTVISSLLAEVLADYGDLDVSFTTTRPASGEYSTVVIGGNDTLIYTGGGTLFGRAQSVDIGNLVKNDVAVVFSGEFGNFYMNQAWPPYQTDDPDQVARYLATTISHELGHNLGLRHVDNDYDTDIMKKNSPRQNTSTFQDELMDLPAVEQPIWYDDAMKQNDLLYLRSVLGTKGATSLMSQSWGWLHDAMFKWFTLDLGKKTVYDVQLGSCAGPGDDVAPQIYTFDSLSGAQQIMVPNFSGADKFFLIGSSKSGGPVDITTGALGAGGGVDIESALVDWLDADSGEPTGTVALSKAKSGQLKDFTEAAIGASEFADVEWLGKKGLTLTDEDGDTVTIKFSGPGAAAVIQDDPDGDGSGAIQEIVLSNTDPLKSKLTVTVKKARGAVGEGIGFVEIGRVSGTGLKSFTAKTANLVGDGIDLEGYLGSLVLYDVLNGADITAAGTADQKTSLTAHVIGDGTEIDLSSQLSKLTAAAFGDGAVRTPALGSLQVKGDKKLGIDGTWAGDLTLSGEGDPKKTLGSAKIAKDITGGVWDIVGHCGAVSIKGDLGNWTLHSAAGGLLSVKSLAAGLVGAAVNIAVDGLLGAVKVTDWAGGTIHADAMKSLKTRADKKRGLFGDFTGNVTLDGSADAKSTLGSLGIAGDLDAGTWEITGPAGKVSVKGDMNEVHMTVAHDPGDRKAAVGGLSVKGSMNECVLETNGNVGAVKAGAMFDTRIFAGVADGVADLPDPATQIFSDEAGAEQRASIKSVKVSGLKVDRQYVLSFDNTQIAAYDVGTVSLCYADLTGLGDEYGVAAWQVKKVTYKDQDKANKWSWPGKRGQMVDPDPQLTLRLPMTGVGSFTTKERVLKDRLDDAPAAADITGVYARLLEGWVMLGVSTSAEPGADLLVRIGLDTVRGDLLADDDTKSDYSVSVDLNTLAVTVFTGQDEQVDAPGAHAEVSDEGLVVWVPADVFDAYEQIKVLDAVTADAGTLDVFDSCPR